MSKRKRRNAPDIPLFPHFLLFTPEAGGLSVKPHQPAVTKTGLPSLEGLGDDQILAVFEEVQTQFRNQNAFRATLVRPDGGDHMQALVVNSPRFSVKGDPGSIEGAYLQTVGAALSAAMQHAEEHPAADTSL